PLPLEHPVARGGALGGVREQRGGQVVPGDLRDDRVDPAVVGRGHQRNPAAVGRARDADPWVAGPVDAYPARASSSASPRTEFLVPPNPCATRIAGTRPEPGGV